MSLTIFDCDGVLVDSEPIAMSVMREVLVEAGVEIEVEVAYRRFLGISMASAEGILEHDFGLSGAADHLQRVRARLYERFETELTAIPGVAAAIAALDGPYCVASSGQPERIELALRVCGLLAGFEGRIYSATMVEHGKPAPDLFLLAARSMGVEPTRCVVIEDSPAGITAAKRAGMRAFAFVGGGHARAADLRNKVQALGPDLIFDDMGMLPQLLADNS
jgi:HAD superfamily hydrolase (TIGR01509 family)